jgi:hypothetical protein
MLSPQETLEIEAACQRLSTSFGLYVDQHRYDELGALFAANGMLQRVNGSEIVGPVAIARSFDDRPATHRSVHLFGPSLIEIVGRDEATGQCSMLAIVVHESSPGGAMRVAGLYQDRYRRFNQVWKFTQRVPVVTVRDF